MKAAQCDELWRINIVYVENALGLECVAAFILECSGHKLQIILPNIKVSPKLLARHQVTRTLLSFQKKYY